MLWVTNKSKPVSFCSPLDVSNMLIGKLRTSAWTLLATADRALFLTSQLIFSLSFKRCLIQWTNKKCDVVNPLSPYGSAAICPTCLPKFLSDLTDWVCNTFLYTHTHTHTQGLLILRPRFKEVRLNTVL
uniref:Uncharacterized protein n=1 Tax=Strigamia maritima TaxID=126957 RepID=T1ING1_STRMM